MSRENETRRNTPANPEKKVKRPDNSERRPVEIGGRRKGLEPTRYGDWEKDGRCIDF
jgi:hypothetical protein